MTSHANHFISGLRGRFAAVAVALFAAALLGNPAIGAEHAKAEAKAESAVAADHGHTHGPAGHPTLAKQFGYANYEVIPAVTELSPLGAAPR